jgi:hypothetical protein
MTSPERDAVLNVVRGQLLHSCLTSGILEKFMHAHLRSLSETAWSCDRGALPPTAYLIKSATSEMSSSPDSNDELPKKLLRYPLWMP